MKLQIVAAFYVLQRQLPEKAGFMGFAVKTEDPDTGIFEINVQQVDPAIQEDRIFRTGSGFFRDGPEDFAVRVMDQADGISADRIPGAEEFLRFIQVSVLTADPVIPFRGSVRHRFDISNSLRVDCFHVRFPNLRKRFIPRGPSLTAL